jgi:uncharacterized membrane protein
MIAVTETHFRTTAKAAIYRLFSVALAISITLSFGATISTALSFGAIAMFWGLLWFYIFDRVWLMTNWNRDELGRDSRTRSVIKAILYRLAAIGFSAWLGRMLFLDNNITALIMGATQFVCNISAYFALERMWNMIEWGKVTPAAELDTLS